MSTLLALVADPLAYPFMQRAVAIAVLVGVVSAVLSSFLVLRGWSLMGDAISHAVLPGIVIAFVVGVPLAVGAFVAGLGCALVTGYLKENSRLREDTVMGVVFSGLFAVGLVLFVAVETDQHLNHILFGNVLGVSADDIVETAVIAALTLVVVIAKRRDLVVYAFDPQHGRAIGLPIRFLHYLLLVLLALTIVASLKAVGVVLVVAMLVAPGCTAFLLTDRFDRMLAIAVAISTVSAVIGTIASFHLDAATGPLIVVVQAAFFVAALVLAPRKGMIAVRRRVRADRATSAR